MSAFREVDGGLEWRNSEQFLRIEPWGADSVRVRSGVGALLPDLPGALLEQPPCAPPVIELPPAGSVTRSAEASIGAAIGIQGPPAVLSHGELRVEVSPAGVVRFLDPQGDELLAERPAQFWWPEIGRAHV